jgi:hypothetical protein
VALLEAGEDGVVRIEERQDNRAVNGGGWELSMKPVWLANPGDAIVDGVEGKLCVEVGF